jgi:hypothetical protein
MMTNSERALVTVRPASVDIQVVERARHSVLQRTFHAGTDYHVHTADPDEPSSSTVANPAAPQGEVWFSGIVDLAALIDVLNGTADHRQAALATLATPSAPLPPPATPSASGTPDVTPEGTAALIGEIAPIGRPRVDRGAVWRATCCQPGVMGGLAVRLRIKKDTVDEKPNQEGAPTASESTASESTATKVLPPWQPVVLQSRLPINPADCEKEGAPRSAGQARAGEFLDVDRALRQLLLPNAPSVGFGAGWARASMRFGADLQDDLLDLSLFGSRVQIGVHDGSEARLTLLSQHPTGKHGLSLVYQRSSSAPPPPEPSAPAKSGKTGRSVKTSKTGKASEGSEEPMVRRYAPSFFDLELSPTKPGTRAQVEGAARVATTVRLRPFRLLHKLIGFSSRIEWTLSDSGPLICSFFQNTAALERRSAVLLFAPAPFAPPPVPPISSPAPSVQ